jgi:hypothetical protein
MKQLKNILLFALILTVSSIEAKPLKTNSVYMFGFSASFKDSVIYVTDIQNVQEAWIETKNEFLLGRDQYSYQLKTYLADSLSQPDRVCLVIFALKKKKAEKMYLKLMKKYKKGYEVRYLNAREFKFDAIDMSPDNQ